jgi:hypothetical protein
MDRRRDIARECVARGERLRLLNRDIVAKCATATATTMIVLLAVTAVAAEIPYGLGCGDAPARGIASIMSNSPFTAMRNSRNTHTQACSVTPLCPPR